MNPEKVPAFCHECGNAYPWTSGKIETVKELIQTDPAIGAADKAEVIEAIIVTTTETPRTPAAAEKLKKYFPVVGQTAREVITDLISETAKKIIFGP